MKNNYKFKNEFNNYSSDIFTTDSKYIYPDIVSPVNRLELNPRPTSNEQVYQIQSKNNQLNNRKKTRKLCLFTIIIILIIIVLIIIAVVVTLIVILNKNKNNKTSIPKLKYDCDYGYYGKYCDECGKQFFNPNVKIIGGIEAIPNSWPSLVFIIFNYKFYYTAFGVTYLATRQSYCGGTLISRDTVLTASHCYVNKMVSSEGVNLNVETNNFYPTIESMYTVYLGLHNNNGLSNGIINPPTVKMNIKNFIQHPYYSSSNYLNDIAIIKLKEEVNLTDYIQIACLPDPSISNYPISSNVPVWAAGWGTLSPGGSISEILYNVKMTLYSSSYCKDVSPETAKDWSKQICSGEYAGDKDTCQGDSGGPLFLKDNVNGKSKYILIGITSYGDGCGIAGYPGIYTKVSAYLTWISDNS